MALDKVFDGQGHIYGTELSQYAMEAAISRIGADLLDKKITLIRVNKILLIEINFPGRQDYTIIYHFHRIGSMEFFILTSFMLGTNRTSMKFAPNYFVY